MSVITFQPSSGIGQIPVAELFDVQAFLAEEQFPVSPAKPDPQAITRQVELHARNARNLLRWLGRRDAHKQPFGFVVRP